ncbi:MAG: hypothetical protein IT379_13450 [Deltaproteobacteria bacterium]|nr:hypothetical protein [Deltaproteobacteria bacterium]
MNPRLLLALPLVASLAGLVGCGDPRIRSDDDLQVRLVAAGGSGGERHDAWSDAEPLSLERDVLIDARRVESARIFVEPGTRRRVVAIQLDAEGTRVLEEVTARHRPRRLAVVIGGRIAAAPAIRGVISGGRLIVGASSTDEAEQMRDLLVRE